MFSQVVGKYDMRIALLIQHQDHKSLPVKEAASPHPAIPIFVAHGRVYPDNVAGRDPVELNLIHDYPFLRGRTVVRISPS
jgi:hypothetical protein